MPIIFLCRKTIRLTRSVFRAIRAIRNPNKKILVQPALILPVSGFNEEKITSHFITLKEHAASAKVVHSI